VRQIGDDAPVGTDHLTGPAPLPGNSPADEVDPPTTVADHRSHSLTASQPARRAEAVHQRIAVARAVRRRAATGGRRVGKVRLGDECLAVAEADSQRVRRATADQSDSVVPLAAAAHLPPAGALTDRQDGDQSGPGHNGNDCNRNEMPFGAASAKASLVNRCCRSVVLFGAATARTRNRSTPSARLPAEVDAVHLPNLVRVATEPTADCGARITAARCVRSWPAIDTSACERDRPAPALEGHWRR
jgi:hypothetical protein